MSESAIQLYTTPQADQAPVDIVTELTQLAKRGVRDVMAYSMAIDRLPEEDKLARREALADHRAKSNFEFLTLYAGPTKVMRQIARNSDGSIVTDADGNALYEDFLVPHPYQRLIDQLTS